MDTRNQTFSYKYYLNSDHVHEFTPQQSEATGGNFPRSVCKCGAVRITYPSNSGVMGSVDVIYPAQDAKP